MNTERIGGWAAFLHAGVAIGNLLVVFGILGAAVAADPAQVAVLVTTRPMPLLWLELFKILAAWASLLVVWVMYHWLRGKVGAILPIATASGVFSALLLLCAGWLGGLAILQAGYGWGAALLPARLTVTGVNSFVNGLGMAAIAANGLWLLGIGWVAHHSGQLPMGLYRLALMFGGASIGAYFLPPIALLVLLLGLIWSVWLGSIWLQNRMN